MKAKVLLGAAREAPQEGLFLEIGCIREDHEVPQDGWSTIHLARYCAYRDIQFISVDCVEENVSMANLILDKEGLGPCVVHNDGEKEVASHGPISFLYLDSHRIPRYSTDQWLAAELVPGAMVVIDDAHEYDGLPYGKATELVEIFAEAGTHFKVWHTEPGFRMCVAKFPDGKQRDI